MMRILLLLGTLAAGGVAVLRASRRRHEQATDRIWSRLQRPVPGPDDAGPTTPDRFDPSTVEALPPPARRYLLHAIAPGTPLRRTLQLKMRGAIRLKPGAEWLSMAADQILAPPCGFIWKARVEQGPMRIQGFDRYADGKGVLRWWLYGFIPVVTGEGPDVDRSAAGRLASESILVPAALVRGTVTSWEPVDDSTARATLAVNGESISLDLTVDAEGRLQRVSFQRWRDDRGDGRPGYVRFDVDNFSDERTFGGYTIPTRFRAGWRLGDEDEFPFFYAEIEEATYL